MSSTNNIYEFLYKKAVQIATKAHEGQTRWDPSVPYITHPLDVAASFPYGPEKVAAVLHDVLEDTEVTKADLRRDFAEVPHVVDALCLLTHPKNMTYADYIMRIRDSGNAIARAVKMADIRNNLSDLTKPKEHVQRRDKYQLALKLLELD